MSDKMLDPSALEAVISKEVKDLTDEDITSLISHYRAQRTTFLQTEAAGKTRKAPTVKKGAELASLLSDLDLDI